MAGQFEELKESLVKLDGKLDKVIDGQSELVTNHAISKERIEFIKVELIRSFVEIEQLKKDVASISNSQIKNKWLERLATALITGILISIVIPLFQ